MSIRDFKLTDHQRLGNFLANLANTFDRKKVEYHYVTGIVLDVISNPYDFLNQKISRTESITVKDVLTKKVKEKDFITSGEITNYQLTNFMPMNSAFVQIIDDNAGNDNLSPVLCFPFFSSHVSLPLKPGEYVWMLREDIKGTSLYYWISRKSGILQIEDTNFANFERHSDIINLYNDYEKKQGSETPSEEMFDRANSFSEQNANFVKTIEEIFLNSYAYRKEFTGEPVPRVYKDCGDLLIQGSNNAGIHLTTEKFSKNSDPKEFTQALSDSNTLKTRKPASGALDIYVGRKFEDIESLKTVGNKKNISGNNIYASKNNATNDIITYYEIDKLADAKYKNDTIHLNEIVDNIDDSTNVAGRLYITNNSNFDEAFKTSVEELEDFSGPASILFGKNNRVVSENSFRLTNQSTNSFLDINESGKITLKTMSDEGIIRIQNKNKIELAVREGTDSPEEPYILHSQLAPILKKIGGDIAFLNQIIELLLNAASALPPVAALKTSIETARATAQSGGSASITVPAVEDDDGNIISPEKTISVPVELLGNNINNGNYTSEFSSVVDNDIKSTKIFGE